MKEQVKRLYIQNKITKVRKGKPSSLKIETGETGRTLKRDDG